MSSPDRQALCARIEAAAIARCGAAGLAVSELSAEAFYEDELLFLSVSRRAPDGSLIWRSSHAATPDSAALSHLAIAGDELVDRIGADATLARAFSEAEE